MPKRKKTSDAAIVASAEFAGRTLGRVAGAFDSLKAQLPVDDAGETLVTTGRRKLSSLVNRASVRSAAVLKKTKAATSKTLKAAARARRRTGKLVAGARRTTRTAVTRAKKVAKKARKTVSRRRAARLKR